MYQVNAATHCSGHVFPITLVMHKDLYRFLPFPVHQAAEWGASDEDAGFRARCCWRMAFRIQGKHLLCPLPVPHGANMPHTCIHMQGYQAWNETYWAKPPKKSVLSNNVKCAMQYRQVKGRNQRWTQDLERQYRGNESSTRRSGGVCTRCSLLKLPYLGWAERTSLPAVIKRQTHSFDHLKKFFFYSFSCNIPLPLCPLSTGFMDFSCVFPDIIRDIKLISTCNCRINIGSIIISNVGFLLPATWTQPYMHVNTEVVTLVGSLHKI